MHTDLITETTSRLTHGDISESCKSNPNLDCNYDFPIDLAPIGITIGAESIGKWKLQSKFVLD